MRPATRYATTGGVHVAYQVCGAGPDLVFVPGWTSHVENWWEPGPGGAFMGRLAGFSRLVLFDKRGTGMSDPVFEAPTLEERMDDLRAVMDATDTEAASLLAYSEGGPMALLFAATHPERVDSLVLYGTAARFRQGPDHPFGFTDEEIPSILAEIRERWGDGALLDRFVPGLAHDPQVRELYARVQRLGCSPSMAAALFAGNMEIDVRGALEAVQAPTLVLHRAGDRTVPIEAGRHMAERIPGARFVALAGDNHPPWIGDADAVLVAVEQFLTGSAQRPPGEQVLATVLFTDIVQSTERAGRLGDRAWRAELELHDALTARAVEAHGGRLVKQTGDGALAAFSGPTPAIACAVGLLGELGSAGIACRAGLHTGECERRGDDLSGLAVHIAARVAALAQPGEVLVSRTVADLVVGSRLTFNDRGLHVLKGVPGRWQLQAVAVG